MQLPDLSHLGAFVAVYETGSVSAAARRLFRTQPTVSYQLARVEEALGGALFTRGRKLTATPRAERLYAIVNGFARDLNAIGDAPTATKGLEIAAVAGFGRYVLFPAIRRSLELRRGVRLSFPELDEVLSRVRHRRVDVGFTYRASVDPLLTFTPVYREHLVLVANADWARKLRTRRNFVDVPLVTYDDGDYVIGRWLGHTFGRSHPRWFSAAHAEELEEVLALTEDGIGVTIVPDFSVRSRRLNVVHLRKPALENTVFAVQHSGTPVHPLVNRLLAAIR